MERRHDVSKARFRKFGPIVATAALAVVACVMTRGRLASLCSAAVCALMTLGNFADGGFVGLSRI